MSASRMVVIVLLLMPSLCTAQEPPPLPVEPGRPERVERAPGLLAGRMGMADPGRVAEQMKTELNLDASQTGELTKIVEEQRKLVAQMQEQMRPTPETMKKQKEMADKMRRAREANNQAEIKEASDQLQALRKDNEDRIRPAREKMTQSTEALHDKLKSILREDQKEGFERIWEAQKAGPYGRRIMSQNPRVLHAAIGRLTDLTAGQKTQVEELFKQNEAATKDQRGTAAEPLNQKLYDAVMALLTPEQREKVESRVGSNRSPRRAIRPEEEKAAPPVRNPDDANQPEKPKP